MFWFLLFGFEYYLVKPLLVRFVRGSEAEKLDFESHPFLVQEFNLLLEVAEFLKYVVQTVFLCLFFVFVWIMLVASFGRRATKWRIHEAKFF